MVQLRHPCVCTVYGAVTDIPDVLVARTPPYPTPPHQQPAPPTLHRIIFLATIIPQSSPIIAR